MGIKEYIARLKIFYHTFLEFVDNGIEIPESFQHIITFFKDNHFGENADELGSMLHIIYKISSQHIRNSLFLSKIYQIILYFQDQIKRTFSNSEIFRIFRSDKLLLQFLFKQKIIIIDENIVNLLIEEHGQFYSNFFYPEIKPFLETVKQKIETEHFTNQQISYDEFEKKRQEGENDSPICHLIRNDSLDEFVSIYNEQDLVPYQMIEPSIFETNAFLCKNSEKTTLIEYAAFFGSKKIVEFLLDTGEIVPRYIWIYAIHSGNIDFVYFLEEMDVEPLCHLYDRYFLTAVKCHYNSLAHYLYDYFYEYKDKQFNEEYFGYYNFEFIPDDFTDDYETIFNYACHYDYTKIVKILINDKKVDIHKAILKI